MRVLIALAFASYICSAHSQPIPATSPQQSKAERADTKASEAKPLAPRPEVALPISEAKNTKNTAEDKKADAEKPSLGFWANWRHKFQDDPIVFFTLVLAISTILLWRDTKGLRSVAIRQAKDTREALFIAKQSADAATKSVDDAVLRDRAYVFIENATCPIPDGHMFETENTLQVEYLFHNHGSTAAFLKSWEVDARYIPDGYPGQARFKPAFIGVAPVGADKTSGPHTVQFKLTNEEFSSAKFSKEGRIFFWGFITYEDIFGREHATKWCCEWNFSFNKFVVSNHPEGNNHT